MKPSKKSILKTSSLFGLRKSEPIMTKEKISDLNDAKWPIVRVENVPIVIGEQFNKLKKLDIKIRESLEKAEEAQQSAESARDVTVSLFSHKKEAIEALQESGVQLSEAVVSAAEAQKISFEFQTRLAEITKYLFSLGLSNIALNRTVVRELELKLKGASANRLSELARNEVLNVIKQLKNQEDLLQKQENLSKKVKSNDDLLRSQLEKSKQHDEQLQRQIDKDVQHDEQLQRQIEKDQLHDEELDRIAAEHKKLRTTCLSLKETEKILLERISLNNQIIEQHENSIEQLKINFNALKEVMQKKIRIAVIIVIVVFFGSVIQLLMS